MLRGHLKRKNPCKTLFLQGLLDFLERLGMS